MLVRKLGSTLLHKCIYIDKFIVLWQTASQCIAGRITGSLFVALENTAKRVFFPLKLANYHRAVVPNCGNVLQKYRDYSLNLTLMLNPY